MRRLLFSISLVLLISAFPLSLSAQDLDGKDKIFKDELLDNLPGEWKLTRRIRGQSLENIVKAEYKSGKWVMFAEDSLVRKS